MSGLDGRGSIDTAFLGHEWTLRGTVPASEVYADSETAIWDMCQGCANERGWLEVENAHGRICPWMHEAGEYMGKPMVDVWDGPGGRKMRCHYRKEKPPRRPSGHKNARGQQVLSLWERA